VLPSGKAYDKAARMDRVGCPRSLMCDPIQEHRGNQKRSRKLCPSRKWFRVSEDFFRYVVGYSLDILFLPSLDGCMLAGEQVKREEEKKGGGGGDSSWVVV
jgi:hypothetical protein